MHDFDVHQDWVGMQNVLAANDTRQLIFDLSIHKTLPSTEVVFTGSPKILFIEEKTPLIDPLEPKSWI